MTFTVKFVTAAATLAFAGAAFAQKGETVKIAWIDPLSGLIMGETVELQDGSTLTADEEYLQESIRRPQEKIVAGYPPSMPTYDTILTDQELLQLVEYIKSLSESEAGQ